MRMEERILNEIKPLPCENKGSILEFIVGYMMGSNSSATDGYVAFIEGMEFAIREYKGDEK